MNRNMQPKIHRSATTYSVQNSISDTLISCRRISQENSVCSFNFGCSPSNSRWWISVWSRKPLFAVTHTQIHKRPIYLVNEFRRQKSFSQYPTYFRADVVG
jgi:hypothetical protein